MVPAGPGQEPPASPSLDDYVRSICQLAQPTSVLNKSTVRSRLYRPHRRARAGEKQQQATSLEDSSLHAGGRSPTLPSAGTEDPLNWLFGKSQDQQLNKRDFPRGASPSGGHWGVHTEMDKGRRRLCEARVPDHSVARPDRPQTSNTKGWTSGQSCRVSASACSPRPSSILRSLYLHLPVIHEL